MEGEERRERGEGCKGGGVGGMSSQRDDSGAGRIRRRHSSLLDVRH